MIVLCPSGSSVDLVATCDNRVVLGHAGHRTESHTRTLAGYTHDWLVMCAVFISLQHRRPRAPERQTNLITSLPPLLMDANNLFKVSSAILVVEFWYFDAGQEYWVL